MSYPSPTVTVVVPSRGRTALLERALLSVGAQTVRPLEVVVVADGTTIPHPPPAGDVPVRVVELATSVGGAEARNVGVREARGELIAFLDDDDAWVPTKLEKQLALREATGARVLASRVIAELPGHHQVWPRRLLGPGQDVGDYLLVRRSPLRGETLIQTSCLLVDRDLLLEVPFTTGLPRHQESDWLIRAVHRTGVVPVIHPEPLTYWDCTPRRDRISTGRRWEQSLLWVDGLRPLISPHAYASFLLTGVATIARDASDYRGLLDLLRLSRLRGRPQRQDLLVWASIVLSPPADGRLKQLVKRALVADRSGTADDAVVSVAAGRGPASPHPLADPAALAG